jgi:hypothetical protein
MPSLISSHAAPPAAVGDDLPLASEVVASLPIALRAEDILRSVGYPAGATPPPPVVRSVEQALAEAGPWLEPRGAYALYAMADQTRRTLRIGGATIAGDIGEYLHGARRVAVFMVTAGGEIARQAGLASQRGDAFAGLVLDAIGSWAAETTAEALMARLAGHLGPGESFTLRYSPGYCGMDLDQQRVLFQLAPAGAAGITLLPSLLMQPLKSISGIVGLGPEEVVGVHLSPCELCPQVGCHMRR